MNSHIIASTLRWHALNDVKRSFEIHIDFESFEEFVKVQTALFKHNSGYGNVCSHQGGGSWSITFCGYGFCGGESPHCLQYTPEDDYLCPVCRDS